MKRPFALLGGAALGALTAGALLGERRAEVLAALLAGMGFLALAARVLWALIGKKQNKTDQRLFGVFRWEAFFACVCRGGLMLLTAALCLGLYAGAVRTRVAPAEALSGRTVRLSGTVWNVPEEAYHRFYYEIRVDRVELDGTVRDMDFTARLSTRMPIAGELFDRIECTAALSAFDDTGGLYSGRSYYLARGVDVGGYLSDYESVTVTPGREFSLRKLLYGLRVKAGRIFERRLPDMESGLIRGILLGERWRIDDALYEDFKTVGASHLLVISGLHMSALAGLFLLLLRQVLRPLWLRNLLAGLGILLFLGLIGFPVSAVRSGVMYLLALAASSLGRETDGVNSLGAAVLLICLGNPFSGGDLGLALSVFSTLGILVLGNRTAEALLRPFRNSPRWSRALSPAAAALGMTFSALLFTLPIQIAVFGGISLLAPAAGLLLVLPCTLLLYSSLLALLLSLHPFTCPLAEPLLFCAGHLARLCGALAERLARTPGTFLPLSGPVTALLLLGGLSLFLICRLSRDRAAVCLLLAGAVLLAGWGRAAGKGESETVTLAAPPDLSCVLVMRDDRAVVIAAGGYRSGAARELLRQNNIRRVEAVFLPVQSRAARETACDVLRSYSVERLVAPEGAVLGRDLALAGQKARQLYLPDRGKLELLEGVTFLSERNMGRVTLLSPAASVMVETAASGPGSCSYLFSVSGGSQINSSFTIAANDAIIDLEKLPPGRYLSPGENGLYLELSPGGTAGFRGESICLNWEKRN